ncbi:hypothetical protein C8J57DRAFT_1227057 [Mycena rebaudengoi]|nr:hypothetical protein C8J57DRAFT_1227057 [Mycena rebaudengoi]
MPVGTLGVVVSKQWDIAIGHREDLGPSVPNCGEILAYTVEEVVAGQREKHGRRLSAGAAVEIETMAWRNGSIAVPFDPDGKSEKTTVRAERVVDLEVDASISSWMQARSSASVRVARLVNGQNPASFFACRLAYANPHDIETKSYNLGKWQEKKAETRPPMTGARIEPAMYFYSEESASVLSTDAGGPSAIGSVSLLEQNSRKEEKMRCTADLLLM